MQGGIIDFCDTGLLVGWDREERWASLIQLQQTFRSNPEDLVSNLRGFLLVSSIQKNPEVYKGSFHESLDSFCKYQLVPGEVVAPVTSDPGS